jgi:Tol biopolymer transport system component
VHRFPVPRALAIVIALCVGIVPVVVTTSLPPPGYALAVLPYEPLTTGSWNDRSPSWSPDGNMIAYSSDRGGGWGVWLMKFDAASQRRLSPSGVVADNPSWSPDSSRIAFWSRNGTRTDVRVAFAANSTVLTLTDGRYSVLQGQPKWSPDGTQLLFFTSAASTQLVSVALTNRTLRAVTVVNGSNLSAAWTSPTTVAYSILGENGYQINWADLRTGEGGVIISGVANYTSPAVSLNSSRLAYISNVIAPKYGSNFYPCPYKPGDFNLWVSNLDGRNATFQWAPTGTYIASSFTYPSPYTPGAIGPAQSLAWSYDGKQVAYTASELHGSKIYLWNVVIWATSMASLGPSDANCTDLSWSPDNVNLAFAAVSDGFYHIFLLNTTGQVSPMPVSQVE